MQFLGTAGSSARCFEMSFPSRWAQLWARFVLTGLSNRLGAMYWWFNVTGPTYPTPHYLGEPDFQASAWLQRWADALGWYPDFARFTPDDLCGFLYVQDGPLKTAGVACPLPRLTPVNPLPDACGVCWWLGTSPGWRRGMKRVVIPSVPISAISQSHVDPSVVPFMEAAAREMLAPFVSHGTVFTPALCSFRDSTLTDLTDFVLSRDLAYLHRRNHVRPFRAYAAAPRTPPP